MLHDLYFDCPQCNHTIKASSDLVGRPVECPDCSYEIMVPEIRDGLNPRFRNPSSSASPHSPAGLEDVQTDLEGLAANMRSLLRRQKAQIKQVDFLEGNCTLIYKQLTILDGKPVVDDSDERAKGHQAEPSSEETPSKMNWVALSIGLSLCSLAAAVIGIVALLNVE